MFLFAEARWLMQQFRRVILWHLAWRDNSRVPADYVSYKRGTSQTIESLAPGLPVCPSLGAQQQWTFEAPEVVPCGLATWREAFGCTNRALDGGKSKTP